NPPDHANTDGVNIVRTNNIYIGDTFVQNGDDCLTGTNGTINWTAENIWCKGGHGLSIGSLGGGKVRAIVENVSIRNVQMIDHQNGFRIKSWPGGSGYCRNVTVENFSVEDTWNPLTFRQDYCDQNVGKCVRDDQGLDHSPSFDGSFVSFENINLKNFTMNGAPVYWRSIEFKCAVGGCTNVTLNDINLPGASQCVGFNDTLCSKDPTAPEPTEFVPFPAWLGASN
ncbi:hypothetical protein HK096_002273, partial [Nowakowskiella sp. JEL0078]